MTQTQVVDQQTRRVLHDEILPDLHAALISLNGRTPGSAENQELLELLAGTHRQIADLLHALPAATAPEVERLGLLEALRRTVEQEYAAAFDAVEWEIDPAAQEQLEQMPSLPAGVIYYAAREAVRNAAKYGRSANAEQPFTLTISARSPEGNLSTNAELVVHDNGRGLNSSESPASNSGQGLALHSTMMAIIGGTLSVSSVGEEGTRVVLAFAA